MQLQRKETTILIAHSDLNMRLTLVQLVQADVGSMAKTITTVSEGKKIVSEGTTPDIIILDLEFEGGTGDNWLRELCHPEAGVLRTSSIVVLTGKSIPGLEQIVLGLGASDFIKNNSPSSIIKARLRTQLRHKWAKDKLEGLTKERDEFAATVLSSISDKRQRIEDQTTAMIKYLEKDSTSFASQESLVVMEKGFEVLRGIGKELTDYAAKVIQGRNPNQI